jgi:subtilisin family serine protease
MKSFATTIASLVLMTNIAWSEPSVRLLSERHRTEWNWIEYRISVTNTTSAPIQNPEVRYFAENTWIQYCDNPQHAAQCASIGNPAEATDSLLKVDVDYASRLTPVHKTVSSAGKVTAVNLKFTGALNPGKTLKVNFRIHKKDWSTWSAANDWSYQKSSGVSEPNYFFAVYDSDGNILWGDDPLTGKTNSDVEVWHDRGGNSVVAKYDGDASEVQKAGRFWMLKDVPMNKKETDLLGQAGVTRHFATAWNGKSLILLKSNSNVKKSKLDSLVYGFYNSFSVDDTTKLKSDIQAGDWIEKVRVCAPFGSCHDEVVSLSSIKMTTRCWDDVSMDDCKSIVVTCGGTEASIDHHVVISKNDMSVINCLETSTDVQVLNVIRQGVPDMNSGRKAINVDNLQLSHWNIDFTNNSGNVSSSLFENKKFTGENVIVGVYDGKIYFGHDGLSEWVDGKKTPRQADFDPNQSEENLQRGDRHGTHVAGIIGGNGSGSSNLKYRGIAPKVKFISDGKIIVNQRGHVVNHSHGYCKNDVCYHNSLEENIFWNWNSPSENGDRLPKTYINSAGNYANGYYDEDEEEWKPCEFGKGFHSISFDTKNGIVVGNYASKTKILRTSSSYGPTWDGRIKPDVVAPGSRIQMSQFSTSLPFEAYLDYLHITHDGDGAPYMAVKFGNNANIVDNGFITEMATTSLTNVSDVGATGNQALKWVNNNMSSNYVNWPSSTFGLPSFNVKKGDLIEIRMRLSERTRDLYAIVLQGDIYLASGDDFYQEPKTYVQQKYSVNLKDINDEYFIVSFNWNGEDISSKFFRLGFDMVDAGLVSTVPCENFNGTACYAALGGTSMAAPHVSGVAALMNQVYMEKQSGVKKPEDITSLRNSTSKAILIHTADDMIDGVGIENSVQHDVLAATGNTVRVTYGKGPDFVTGWGAVNAENALKMFNSYNSRRDVFSRFQEFNVSVDMEKRWNVRVNGHMDRLRLTLAWDDAPLMYGASYDDATKYRKKLVNDLDMYLISPSGKYYYPWRLEQLPTDHIDANGNDKKKCTDGTEKITLEEARRLAVRECDKSIEVFEDVIKLPYSCFDHLNNVEVVDVDFPEQGTWIVVVRTDEIQNGNSEDGHAQVASIASDLPLYDYNENIGCEMMHPYRPQSTLTCSYSFENSLTNFVTFSNQTFVGPGDYIYLLDDKNDIIGTYTGSQLAGARLKIDSSKLTVKLESSNNKSEKRYYGFSIDKIEMIPYSMLFGVSH